MAVWWIRPWELLPIAYCQLTFCNTRSFVLPLLISESEYFFGDWFWIYTYKLNHLLLPTWQKKKKPLSLGGNLIHMITNSVSLELKYSFSMLI